MRQSEQRISPRHGWVSGIRALSLSAAVLLGTWPAAAQTPSKPEKERQRLLEQLGLERRKAPAAAESSPGEESKQKDDGRNAASQAPSAPQTPDPAARDAAGDKAQAAPALGFGGRVHSTLLAACGACHGPGRPAARGYVLGGAPDADFAATRRYVSPGQAEGSALLRLAAGAGHAGGAVLPASRAEHQLLARWISEGAKRGGEASAPSPPPGPSAPPALPAPSVAAPSTPPTSSVTSPKPAAEASDTSPAPTSIPPSDSATTAGSEQAVVYAPVIHEQLTGACASCHRAGAIAGSSGYLLTGDIGADFASARRFVNLQHPEQSALLQKTSGAPHAGGAPYPPGSEPYLRLLAWIQFGALGPYAVVAGAEPAPASSVAAGPPAVAPAPAQPSPPAGGSPEHAPGLTLPLQLRLNGRFDLSYERRNFDTHPFGAGDNALQSYHHFLFLSRQGHEDRIGFTLELVNLTFWEVSYRLPLRADLGQLWVKAGKLLVPFGVDPLFHQSYGGLAGFDQRFLPVIWAREGFAARWAREHGEFSWSADLYTVAGHELRQPDAVLSLQGDLSPLDSTQIAFGGRLRGAYGPLSLYYSGYVNRLGFSRLLYLQALDLALWRPRAARVLQRFAVDLGLSRADVSGAGPGEDYYHFASYFRVRYFPLDTLYLQYRQGLRTFDNRRGVIFDDTRATAEDGSTHNFGAVARGGPLTFGLYYFFNLEKAGELDDDFLRVTGTYEF